MEGAVDFLFGLALAVAPTLGCGGSVSSAASDAGRDGVGSNGNGNSSSGSGGTGTGGGLAGDADVSRADGASTCPDCPTYPVDTYAPGLTKNGQPVSGNPSDAGATGSLTFILESDEVGDASSGPAVFTNVFTLELIDSNGQPVKDATVLLPTADEALGWPFARNPWMPCHGHGSSTTTTVTNNGDGTYSLSIFFDFPALWQIYIVAETDTVIESALYSFCVM